MNIPSIVFRYAVGSKRPTRRAWSLLRSVLVRALGDPICTMQIHGRSMKINLSHDLPIYQAQYPYYDALPRRLGAFLRGRYGALKGVDVGANIGDTIAAFIGDSRDRFLGIEPNPKFFSILQANWAGDSRVTTIDVMCSAGSRSASFEILERKGTASIVETQAGATMKQQPLDDIVAEHPVFAGINLIKVDTDGHDFDVLSGAVQTIAGNRPAVLFECDSFGRVDYTESVLHALDMFKRCGYSNYLVYDNFGYLIGCHSLDDHSDVMALLFYQLTSDFHYFDLLLMTEPDLAAFNAAEVRFFAEQRVAPALRQTALLAGSGRPSPLPA